MGNCCPCTGFKGISCGNSTQSILPLGKSGLKLPALSQKKNSAVPVVQKPLIETTVAISDDLAPVGFKCSVCEHTYTRMSSLIRHLKTNKHKTNVALRGVSVKKSMGVII